MHWNFRESCFNFSWNMTYFGCPSMYLDTFMRFLGQWEREEGGGGVGFTTVQGLPCSTLWPQQYRGGQEAHILLQRPWWVQTSHYTDWLTLTNETTLKIAVFVAGVHHVFDTTFTRTFSLLESQREFVERFQRKEQDNKSLPMMTSACPGIPKIKLFLEFKVLSLTALSVVFRL